MGEGKHAGELELKSDLAHERREWRVQRVGWLLLALFCGCALAGLLGPGPLSKQHTGKVGSELYLEYDRYIRKQSPYGLKVFSRPDATRDQFTITLDRAFIENVEVKGIQPEPTDTTAAANEYQFHFKRSGEGEQLVVFHFEPDSFGRIETSVKLDDKASHKIKQFVWP